MKKYIQLAGLTCFGLLLILVVLPSYVSAQTAKSCVVTDIGKPNTTPVLPPECASSGGPVNCSGPICAFEYMVGKNDFCCKWGDGRNHKGVDLITKEGVPIKALEPGKVITSTFDDTCGWIIKLHYDNKRFALHCHMLRKGLAVNTRVERGTVIGHVSNTGSQGGSAKHLHYQISTPGTDQYNAWANPEIILKNWPQY